MGWGVLLWSTSNPPVQSGTVLPVYIRSNINRVWVVGFPDGMQGPGGMDKFEVPLERFEFVGRKAKANRRAAVFSKYALTYAENLQDGLPIRDNPDNNARRVYRLRAGEIIKILYVAGGTQAIGFDGNPLDGAWYRVLTEDGTTGFCFSLRLKFFENYDWMSTDDDSNFVFDSESAGAVIQDEFSGSDLDMIMSKTWSPESYSEMVSSRKINLDEFTRRWRFEPGQDTNVARIFISDMNRSYPYTAITPAGPRTWVFEGSNLTMQLRNDNLLAVLYTEEGGIVRTLLFVSLPLSPDEIIVQETGRRNRAYNAVFNQGPVFTSSNYGTIELRANREFTWTGSELLVPQIIPEMTDGRGTISMDLFVDPSLEGRYTGAFSMRFGSPARPTYVLRCLYFIDNQGLRLEIAPEAGIDDVTVTRRAGSPMVMFFSGGPVPAPTPAIPESPDTDADTDTESE